MWASTYICTVLNGLVKLYTFICKCENSLKHYISKRGSERAVSKLQRYKTEGLSTLKKNHSSNPISQDWRNQCRVSPVATARKSPSSRSECVGLPSSSPFCLDPLYSIWCCLHPGQIVTIQFTCPHSSPLGHTFTVHTEVCAARFLGTFDPVMLTAMFSRCSCVG